MSKYQFKLPELGEGMVEGLSASGTLRKVTTSQRMLTWLTSKTTSPQKIFRHRLMVRLRRF